jgi:hypothetical protein
VTNKFGLRLHAYRSPDGCQISGGVGMTDMGRCLAMWLSTVVSPLSFDEWLEAFREHASDHPEEAQAIIAAWAEYLLPSPGSTVASEETSGGRTDAVAEGDAS